MQAAAPGIIIETKLFPGENNLFLDVSGQRNFLELVHLQISELLERQRFLVTPTTPPVYGMALSDFSNPTDAPAPSPAVTLTPVATPTSAVEPPVSEIIPTPVATPTSAVMSTLVVTSTSAVVPTSVKMPTSVMTPTHAVMSTPAVTPIPVMMPTPAVMTSAVTPTPVCGPEPAPIIHLGPSEKYFSRKYLACLQCVDKLIEDEVCTNSCWFCASCYILMSPFIMNGPQDFV
jgi:hypothetical protein